MPHDLSKVDRARQTVRADVIVIGAGIAGLMLAARLRRQGCHVIVLESGGEDQAGDRHPLNEVVQGGQVYRGAEEGRFRCLGGTSTRWGGAMLPFPRDDLAAHRQGWDVEWPVSIDELAPRFGELEQIFGLPNGGFELDEPIGNRAAENGFRMRSAKWPNFRMRNVAHVLRADIADPGIDLWLNATVTAFRLDEGGRLAAVTASGPSGCELTAEAPVFAIAAGAIESTRLLLLLNWQHDNRIFVSDGVLGRYFYDHLSAPAATFSNIDRDALVTAFGLRFDERGMRDCRIEPTASLRAEFALPGAFAHIAAVSNDDEGFTALRSIYRAFQRSGYPDMRHVAPLARNLGWLVRAAWWRFVNGRLLPPPGASFELALVTEQMPHPDNRITLAPERKDAHGAPLAKIDWQIREPDLEAFRLLQSALLDYWRESGLHKLATPLRTPLEIWRGRMHQGGGIYHPGGSSRMGTSRTRAVVDADLKTFDVGNLYVVSTSTFPSGGSANPSFMLMAFALRAADRIAALLRPNAATPTVDSAGVYE